MKFFAPAFLLAAVAMAAPTTQPDNVAAVERRQLENASWKWYKRGDAPAVHDKHQTEDIGEQWFKRQVENASEQWLKRQIENGGWEWLKRSDAPVTRDKRQLENASWKWL
ncbi:hypothetical protein FBU59_001166 [Linderina macrospora]|uniref:Uncharacterized protein n=1 Tax=Linderina macrospora TaxID=4868 RepID=A0ACC1JF14_9FUNG|nr:hypothetical protein FBU59_001166 [Linderina macrospora]